MITSTECCDGVTRQSRANVIATCSPTIVTINFRSRYRRTSDVFRMS